MFGEGPGNKEDFIKAEVEIKTGSLGNESAIALAKEKRQAVEDWKTLCDNATELAKYFVESKKEKAENT